LSNPYTDRFGHPLTAAQALKRMQAPKRRGYYRDGVWVQLPAKPTAAAKPT
jgi:hypothetical protein